MIQKPPTLTQVEDWRRGLTQLRKELNDLSEQKRARLSAVGDDKLSLFRQQATIISQKRMTAEDQLSKLKHEQEQLKKEYVNKQALSKVMKVPC
jgi:uncharacterized protein (DUF3084 family)